MESQRWMGVASLSALVLGTAFIFAWMARGALHDPKIAYFDHRPPANWIIPNCPRTALSHPAIEHRAEFRRRFSLTALSTAAPVHIRGFRDVTLIVNGTTVAPAPNSNWKQIRAVEVAPLLKTGANEIHAIVGNEFGPPALWFDLDLTGQRIVSDLDWEASWAGAPFVPVRLATAHGEIEDALLPSTGEVEKSSLIGSQMVESWNKVWRSFAIVMVFSAAMVIGGSWLLRWTRERFPVMEAWAPPVLMAALWIALFIHNLPFLPNGVGFDAKEHLVYVDVLQREHRFPLASEGLEFFQPPLFHFLAAVVLTISGLSTASPHATQILRAMTMLAGIAHFSLIYASARLLFPQSRFRQWAALLLAGFLPMHLYMFQYVTNEALAGTFASLSLCLALWILRDENPPTWRYLLLGLALGAGLLTKLTTLAMAVVVLATLAIRALVPPGNKGMRLLKSVLAPTIACLLTSGWHYARAWWNFGDPFIGTWDAKTGYRWWQYPGYRELGFFTDRGHAWSSPRFSGFQSFIDGMYSSFWGDGLMGGSASLLNASPWSLDHENVGYLLSALPMVAIGIGFLAALWSMARRFRPEWFLLAGLVAATAALLVQMNLKVPYLCSVKAFYAMPATGALCLLGAWGLDLMGLRSRIGGAAVMTCLCAWGVNSYQTYWIDGDAASTWTRKGRDLASAGQYQQAAVLFAKAHERDPSDLAAIIGLAVSNEQLGGRDKCEQLLRARLQKDPNNFECLVVLSDFLIRSGRKDEPKELLRRAVGLAPNDARPWLMLGSLAAMAGDHAGAIAHYKEALRIDPLRPDAQYEIGAVFANHGDWTPAVEHLAYSVAMEPMEEQPIQSLCDALVKSGRFEDAIAALRKNLNKRSSKDLNLPPDGTAKVQLKLAWLLATAPDPALRNGEEAFRLSREGGQLIGAPTPERDMTTAAALAELGQFEQASTLLDRWLVERASSDSRSAGVDAELRGKLLAQQKLYREKKPLREGQ